jgi:hypothetical protein
MAFVTILGTVTILLDLQINGVTVLLCKWLLFVVTKGTVTMNNR